jgi:hypothetical protein
MHFDYVTALGLLAGAFYLASHFMEYMVPLRVLALMSNVLFIVYGLLHTQVDIRELLDLP